MTDTYPQLTGAEILWTTVAAEGTTTVFGYPSGAIRLHRQPRSRRH